MPRLIAYFIGVFCILYITSQGQFTKESIDCQPGIIYSNLLKLDLDSGTYTLTYPSTSDLNFISSLKQELYSTGSKTSNIVLRFKISEEQVSDLNQFCIKISSKDSLYTENHCFAYVVQPKHKVEASLLGTEDFVQKDQLTQSVRLYVANKGNVPENLILTVANHNYYSWGDTVRLNLSPGADTVLSKAIHFVRTPSALSPDLHVDIRTSQRLFTVRKSFSFYINEYRENPFRYPSIPTYFDLAYQQFGSYGSVMMANFMGSKSINERQRVGFRLFSIANLGTPYRFQIPRWELNWNSSTHFLAIGRLQDNEYGRIQGLGVKGGLILQKFKINSKWLRDDVSKRYLWDNQVEFLEEDFAFRLGLSHVSARQFGFNNPTILKAEWSKSSRSGLSFGLKLNFTDIVNGLEAFQTKGFLRFDNKNWLVNGTYSFTEPNYPTFEQGQERFNLMASKRVNGIELGVSMNFSQVKLAYDEELGYSRNGTKSNDLFMRIRFPKGSYSLFAGVEQMDFNQLSSLYYRPRFLLNYQPFPKMNIDLDLDVGYQLLDSISTYKHNLVSRIDLHGFRLVSRWNQGPRNYYDQVLLLAFNQNSHYSFNQIRSPRVDFLNHQWDAVSDWLSTRFSDYYSIGGGMHSVRNKLSYDITGQLRFGGAKPIPILSARVSYSASVPLPIKEIYHDLKIKLYRDVDADNFNDDTDPPAVGQLVGIDGVWLMTNEEGEVYLENLSGGIHFIQLAKVKVDGFIVSGANQREVELRKGKVIRVALSPSAKVSGRVAMQRGKRAKGSLNLENIKVKASDTFGNTYYALTDRGGSFTFNLPEGIYSVELNPHLFPPRKFDVSAYMQEVKIHIGENKPILFRVREKERKVILRN